MWSANAARDLLADHLSLLDDIAAIGAELSVLEQRFGATPDLQDARHRQQQMCVDLLEGLWALLTSRVAARLPCATMVH
jgi:hypothetical protein